MNKKPGSEETGQDALMIRYLLGDVTEQEQLRLEEQFFADDESYQQLLALEDELKYEYAGGGLTAKQRESFEKRFLVSAEDRQKVALAKAVLTKAYELRGATAAAPIERVGWWQSLLNFFQMRGSGMQLSFASAALIFLTFGSWMLYQTIELRGRVEELQSKQRSDEQNAQKQLAAERTRQQQLQQELAQERDRRTELERQMDKRPAQPGFFSFLLLPGLVRDADGAKQLTIPAGAREVRLDLDVKSRGPYKSYRAELQTLDGAQISSQNIPRPRLTISARLLTPGDYVVALKGITASGEVEDAGEYYFVVVR